MKGVPCVGHIVHAAFDKFHRLHRLGRVVRAVHAPFATLSRLHSTPVSFPSVQRGRVDARARAQCTSSAAGPATRG